VGQPVATRSEREGGEEEVEEAERREGDLDSRSLIPGVKLKYFQAIIFPIAARKLMFASLLEDKKGDPLHTASSSC
jgi:hypothetical protein